MSVAERVNWTHNLHTVDSRRQPLGVECKSCGHRGLLHPNKIGAHKGNMKRILDLPLKCIECGDRRFAAWLFAADGEAEEWAKGPDF